MVCGGWIQGLCAMGKRPGGQERVRLVAGDSARVSLQTWVIEMNTESAPLSTILMQASRPVLPSSFSVLAPFLPGLFQKCITGQGRVPEALQMWHMLLHSFEPAPKPEKIIWCLLGCKLCFCTNGGPGALEGEVMESRIFLHHAACGSYFFESTCNCLKIVSVQANRMKCSGRSYMGGWTWQSIVLSFDSEGCL